MYTQDKKEEILEVLSSLSTEDLFRLTFGDATRESMLLDLEERLQDMDPEELQSFEQEVLEVMNVDLNDRDMPSSEDEDEEMAFKAQLVWGEDVL